MTSYRLSDNQKAVLEAILTTIQTKGYPPSLREIMGITGISSLRGVTLQLDTLEQNGFISRKDKARGIVVAPFLLNGNNEKIKIPITSTNATDEKLVAVPMMTSAISAGMPVLVDDYSNHTIEVTTSQTKGLKNVFAVRVSGDSMVGSGIDDGNIAIVSPQQVADDGEIVAALVNGGVTLKKYRVVEGIPMLFPANPKYLPISGNFEIQGKLINVIKNDPNHTYHW